MCRRWIAVAAVAAVVAFALVGAGAAGAPAQARAQTNCFWSQEGASKFGIGANYAFPDSGAVYWAAQITMPAGSYIVLRGRFAHARYQSLNAYDASSHAPVDGYSPEETRAAAMQVLPDVLHYDRDKPAAYPNGRDLTDDVYSMRFAWLSNGKVPPSGLNPHDDLQSDFPYLGVPNPTPVVTRS